MRNLVTYLLMAALVTGLAASAAFGQGKLKEYGDFESEIDLNQTIYTPQNAPEAPAVGDLPKQKSVTQYGITWTFDKEVPVGQFITGDYYVVGPVKVVEIDPAPIQGVEAVKAAGFELIKKAAIDDERYGELVSRHGSMLNPTGEKINSGKGKTGFDSRLAHVTFDPKWFEKPPFELTPGGSLISTISNPEIVDFRGYDQPVLTAAVLTCLEKPVPADAFRPSFADMENRIYLARNLQRDLLYNLPRPKEAPESIEGHVRRFHRPWIDFTAWGYGAPLKNMPRYGRGYVSAVSNVSLVLQLDYPAAHKEKLLIHFVQYGIDIGGLVRSGFKGWPGHGGFGAGRRWTIIFAGLMLGEEEFLDLKKLNPQARFAEVDQTSWGKSWHGDDEVFESHPGWRPEPSEKTHPSKWDKGHLQSESYRLSVTSVEWVGQALAMRMMRAERLFNHDPFFAYVDRWMTEDMAERVTTWVTEMAKAKGVDVEKNPPKMPWYVRAQLSNKTAGAMWKKYRENLPEIKPAMKKWALTEEIQAPKE